ncbi:hypothetical protein Sden_3157 [Shewanella denitrificans OS217]|jgi:hypothetical protein|uniref:Lipoprotein n=1 Tax=Shewanella denitrificans (strain OS217 / ATCC BAA-1090 / DSM 15013) TaxID=318161 RepID=Q12JE3_SHEDO|nr:hypothetical protein [Shewanella denitrificans]ABE56433.1 hypothetical protein Sden_3157 [Shewanella denitrificans OS217]
MEKCFFEALILLCILTALSGCKSPNRDDYISAKLLSKADFIQEEQFTFSLESLSAIDVRGEYVNDDSINQPSIMYAGIGAGGMLAQVVAHAAINSSLQDNALSERQIMANMQIEPISRLVLETKFQDFLGKYQDFYVSIDKADNKTIFLKPIYFVSQNLERLSLKMVVWSGKKNKGKRKQNWEYQNLIEVNSRVLNKDEIDKIISGQGKELLDALLMEMSQLALSSLQSEVTGVISQRLLDPSVKPATITIKTGETKEYIRGTIVEHSCRYTLIRNLRNWLIHYPTSQVLSPEVVGELTDYPKDHPAYCLTKAL